MSLHVAKLGDFGLARDTSEQFQISFTMGIGSSWYMSPEQIRLERYGQSSDIWALGVILFELLAGFRPFSTPKETKKSDPRPLPGYVSKPLADLISNLLNKDQT